MTERSKIPNVRKAVRRELNASNRVAADIEIQMVRFNTGDHTIPFNVDITSETVWATQQQIAHLFDKDRRTIGEHIANIISEEELDENSVCRNFRHTAGDGKTYEITHYDLDMILAVGFRTKSSKAREFRQWAYKILRGYLIEGYALNEARLRDDPEALQKLAEEIRALRDEEKSFYYIVKECFKKGSSDYDPKSPITRTFYARLQNTFHFAITRKTAAEIKLERARYNLPNMGMKTGKPSKDSAQVAKNYLESNELRRYRILSEQFTLFTEERAARGEETSMQQMLDQFNKLLDVGDYAVLPDGPDYSANKAHKHVQAQYAMWSTRQKRVTDQRPSK